MKKGWSLFKRVLRPKSIRIAISPVALILLVFLLQAGYPISPAPAHSYNAAPVSQVTAQITPQPSQTPANTQEIDKNREQTTGIIIGAIFLMLIIVGGTLLVERAQKET